MSGISMVDSQDFQVKAFKDSTVKEFLHELSGKTPVPGGGAVAALCAASACGLISMAGRYAQGKGKPARVEARLEKIILESVRLRDRFLELADLDAQAYLKVVAARSGTAREKRSARVAATAVPRETARLCQKAVALTPFLAREGSPYLLSDVEIAVELLLAAYRCSMINIRVNQ